jgi:copper chaperone CopZ
MTLPVKGMNFAGCAPETEKQPGQVAGIREVAASSVSQTVTVTYEEATVNEM